MRVGRGRVFRWRRRRPQSGRRNRDIADGRRHAISPVADYSDSLPGEPGGMVADKHGAVVEVDDRTVVAFDRAGEQLWSSPVPGAALGWPVLSDQLVVVPTLTADGLGESDGHSGADDSGGCVALDRTTGARRWSYEEAGSERRLGRERGCSGVLRVRRRDRSPRSTASTGALLWRVLVDTRVPAAPVAVSERSAVVVDAASGTLSFTARWAAHWMLIVRDLATGTGQRRIRSRSEGSAELPHIRRARPGRGRCR